MTKSGNLWAIGYDNMERAIQVRDEIINLGWHKHYLQLDDVAVVVLMVEYGDRLGLAIGESRVAVIKHFGDSVLAEASFSFVALGLGIALGAAVGLIPIPILGIGKVTLGLAGGPLAAAYGIAAG